MANRTRNIVLRVPVTAEERAMIERKMQQMGTGCFSVYARKMLIDGYVIRLDYSDVKAMTAELQKIGTNINQIAKRVNATGTLYALLEMSRNVQSGNTQNLKSTVIQRSFPKWSVAERRKTAAASDQAACCARIHSRYFTGGSPSGLRV